MLSQKKKRKETEGHEPFSPASTYLSPPTQLAHPDPGNPPNANLASRAKVLGIRSVSSRHLAMKLRGEPPQEVGWVGMNPHIRLLNFALGRVAKVIVAGRDYNLPSGFNI